MDLSNPASAVVPTVDAAVLCVLAGTSRPLTGREVQRLCGHSRTRVQAILTRMAEHGLVSAVEAGPSRLYNLNREHVAAEAVTVLADLRGRLFERIRERLAGWATPPIAAAAFGSAARGDGGPESDIDVFLVRPDGIEPDDPEWEMNVDALSRSIAQWSGNRASIIQATPGQVGAMINRREPIVSELEQDSIALTEAGILSIAARTAR